MDSLKIFVCCHDRKSVDTALENIANSDNPKMYQPILCGDNNKFLKESKYREVLSDTTGDSISLYNKYFNELTGMYWLAKNLRNLPEYVGIAHYRRFPRIGREELAMLKRKRQVLVFDGMDGAYCDCMYNSWQNQNEASSGGSVKFIDELKIYKYMNRDIYPKNIYDLIIPYIKSGSKGVQYRYLAIMPRKMFKDMIEFYEPILETYMKVIDSEKYPGVNREFGYVLECLYSHFLNIYSNMFSMEVTRLGKDHVHFDKVTPKRK